MVNWQLQNAGAPQQRGHASATPDHSGPLKSSPGQPVTETVLGGEVFPVYES